MAVPGVAQAGPLIQPNQGFQPNFPAASPAPTAPADTSGASSPTAQIIQAARQQGVSDEQIFTYLHQNGMIPTSALAQDNSQPTDPNAVGGAAGVGLGATKGALSSLNNLSDLGQKVLSRTAGRVANLVTGHGFTPTQESTIPKENLQAHGTAEKIGFGAEQIGEFFIPGAVISEAGKAGKLAVEGLDLAAQYGKAGQLATGALKIGAQAAAEGLGAAAVTGVQTESLGQAVQNGVLTAGLSGGLQVLGKGVSFLQKTLKNVSSNLQLSTLRMTPVQKISNAPKLGALGEYLNDIIPVGSPQARFEAATADIAKREDILQQFLKTEAGGITAPKQDLLDAAEQLKREFVTDRDFLEISKQIDGFKSLVSTVYPDDIPLTVLNQLKRSTFEKAFNAAGTKVSDAVEYRLGDVMKSGLENATDGLTVGGKPLGQFNEAYGVALTARKLLRTAVGRPESSFVNRLAADAIGGLLGHAVGGPVGGAVGTAAGAAISQTAPVAASKAIAGKVINKAANVIPKVKLPAGSAGALVKVFKP